MYFILCVYYCKIQAKPRRTLFAFASRDPRDSWPARMITYFVTGSGSRIAASYAVTPGLFGLFIYFVPRPYFVTWNAEARRVTWLKLETSSPSIEEHDFFCDTFSTFSARLKAADKKWRDLILYTIITGPTAVTQHDGGRGRNNDIRRRRTAVDRGEAEGNLYLYLSLLLLSEKETDNHKKYMLLATLLLLACDAATGFTHCPTALRAPPIAQSLIKRSAPPTAALPLPPLHMAAAAGSESVAHGGIYCFELFALGKMQIYWQPIAAWIRWAFTVTRGEAALLLVVICMYRVLRKNSWRRPFLTAATVVEPEPEPEPEIVDNNKSMELAFKELGEALAAAAEATANELKRSLEPPPVPPLWRSPERWFGSWWVEPLQPPPTSRFG